MLRVSEWGVRVRVEWMGVRGSMGVGVEMELTI